jgi:uncharacterized Zn finger protein
MQVIKKYNQIRRDCHVDLECESCGNKKTLTGAYDDRNYWDNVVPSFKCEKCGKSSKDLGTKTKFIKTKYDDYEQV